MPSIKKHIFYNFNSFIAILLFLIAIFIPLLGGIVEKDHDISLIEKRKLSTFPKIGWSINDIKKFPKLFDAYYSDHFGFRDWLTSYYKLIKFSIGDSPSDDVTIGKEGWLFLGSIKKGYNRYSDPIGDARNVNLYSNDDLKKFARYMVSLKTWLNEKGLEYIFIIAPNKHTIYFDKLPDYITKVNAQSSTDQVVEYLKAHTTVIVIDLRKILIDNKKKYQLYYKTDTHWNHNAANIAQYKIMLTLEKLYPNLITPKIFTLKKEGVRGGGDLSNFIGVKGFKESNPRPVFRDSCKPILKGVVGRTTHSFLCEGKKLNALIFMDSFFLGLEPYFARQFKKSTYVWQKLNYPSLKENLKKEHYDIVIEEWAERSLPLVPQKVPEFSYHLNKKCFADSVNSIFLNDFEKLKYNSHIKHRESSNKYLEIESVGRDPIILFPQLPFKPGSQYIVHIKATSTINSVLQLFYSDAEGTGNPFSEKYSVRVSINAGINDHYILIDHNKLGKQLRLDPISGMGKIKISKIEIREIGNQLTKTCTRTK